VKVDIRGRGAGKTYDMIQWLLDSIESEYDGPLRAILVPTNVHRRELVERLRKWVEKDLLQRLADRILLPDEARTGLRRDAWEIGVDNVDLVLSEIFDNQVTYITLEGDGEGQENQWT